MTIQRKFINDYKDAIIRSTANTGLFPSVTMAQACLETGYGKNTVSNAKNLFGIKAVGSQNQYWRGDYTEARTREVLRGESVYITTKFRKYSTFEDSIRDRNNLLLTLARYKPVREAKTPEEQCRQLQVCGYATGLNYANTLISIINKNNLKTLDN